MSLDVEYKYSLSTAKTSGRWNVNKDKGQITFNLEILYNHSKRSIDKFISQGRSYGQEDIENLFIINLIETELVERICIERAYQKIRLKGHSRCKPFCVCEMPALCMAYPDSWNGPKGVRSFVNDQRRRAGMNIPITANEIQ